MSKRRRAAGGAPPEPRPGETVPALRGAEDSADPTRDPRSRASATEAETVAVPASFRVPEWVWPAFLLPGLVALLWSLRGGIPGTAAADDYSFLTRLRFHQPLDP